MFVQRIGQKPEIQAEARKTERRQHNLFVDDRLIVQHADAVNPDDLASRFQIQRLRLVILRRAAANVSGAGQGIHAPARRVVQHEERKQGAVGIQNGHRRPLALIAHQTLFQRQLIQRLAQRALTDAVLLRQRHFTGQKAPGGSIRPPQCG